MYVGSFGGCVHAYERFGGVCMWLGRPGGEYMQIVA